MSADLRAKNRDMIMLNAVELNLNPEILDEIKVQYKTLYDHSTTGSVTLNNLEKAMNIMTIKGWKPIAMSSNTFVTYIIMENINFVSQK